MGSGLCLCQCLEEQIESYRDDKRHLMSEVTSLREESGNRQFKVAELERVCNTAPTIWSCDESCS